MRRILLASILVLGSTACESEPTPEAPEKAPEKAAPPAKAPQKAPADAKAAGPQPFPLPADAHPAWTDPTKATEEAPATFTCQFDTTQGTFDVAVTREWAPVGADRFYNLCKIGFWDGARFFRNIDGFMVQFGMSAYPEATQAWKTATIKDDPVTQTNAPLMVTFAKTGAPDSRSTQVFINHGNNKNLDSMGFAPFGKIRAGADVVGKLHSGYGEGAPRGKGPRQDLLGAYGETYLADKFDKLDKINKTTVK